MDWESESDVGEDSENNITNWESKFVPDPPSQGNGLFKVNLENGHFRV